MDKDPLKYMEKANQNGTFIIKLCYDYLIIICPISVLVNGAITGIFNKLKYGHIDPSNGFRAYYLVYEIHNFDVINLILKVSKK